MSIRSQKNFFGGAAGRVEGWQGRSGSGEIEQRADVVRVGSPERRDISRPGLLRPRRGLAGRGAAFHKESRRPRVKGWVSHGRLGRAAEHQHHAGSGPYERSPDRQISSVCRRKTAAVFGT